MLSLYLLNISVDSADPYAEYFKEDLSINDQESIIEIVVEKIIGYENAIKEYDDNDSENQNKSNNSQIDLITHFANSSTIKELISESFKQILPEYCKVLTSGFQKLTTPPPQI